jgi:hypothetical protein
MDAMRTRRRYRPGQWDRLEAREVLTHGGPFAPALIGTLSPNPRASGPLGRIQAQVNQAFDQFRQDYFQAQGAYLSSGAPAAPFTAFTIQRTNLLAGDLTRTLVRLPGSLARINNAHQRSKTGSSVVLQAFLHNAINGPAPSTSLLQTLNSPSVMPPVGTSGAAASLYTLAASNAIQSARVATINAVRFIQNDSFGNTKHGF